jgi:hypothetical protein
MNDDVRTGRLAGLLYLIVVVAGMFSLAYVPSRINVANDPSATLNNILAFEPLFRLGIASFLIKQVAFLLLPLLLYRLFRQVEARSAMLMVALAAVSVPLALVSLMCRLDVLTILNSPYLAQTLTSEQLRATAKISLDSYRNGILVTSLFWGLWLLPFGRLVLKSGFMPRILGVLLMLGGLGYVVDVFGSVLMVHYGDSAMSNYILLPAALGELGTCAWLLLMGVRLPGYRPA